MKSTLVFIHGAGETTSDGAPWTDDMLRALERCGYSFDEEEVRSRVVSPTYTAHLVDHLAVPVASDNHDLPEVRRGHLEEGRSAFEERQKTIENSLPPGFPVGGPVSGVFRAASGSAALTGLAARRRSREAAIYIRSADRREAVRRAVIKQLEAVRGDIVLVGHSLGSVVALDLLARLPERLKVSTFITLGSPWAVSLFADLIAKWAPAFPYDSVDCWVNFYDPEDPITGGRGLRAVVEAAGGPYVIDQVVENGGASANHGSTRYLDHFVVARHLAEHFIDDDLPRELTDADDVRRATWFDAGLRAAIRRHVIVSESDKTAQARMAVANDYLTAEAITKLGLSPKADLTDVFKHASVPPSDVARRTVVDLLAAEPFAPFEIDVPLERRHAAMTHVAARLGQSDAELLRAYQAVRAAVACQANNRVALGRTLVLGAAIAAVAIPGVVVGALAAPGLAGAAAFASGLSALGGGSMAAGITAAAATGAVSTSAAAVALDRMSPTELVDSVVRMHAEARLLAKSGELSGAQNIRDAVASLRYESSRMAREHRAIDDSKENADGNEAAAASCRAALEDLRKVLLPH